jgi:alkylation response protein AidB-like acyl-CoA dehydrogenase
MMTSMSLVLTEDQALLERTARAFGAEHAPVSRLRRLRDSRDELGYARDVYRAMAELGWAAIPFEERDGGAGMGLAEAIIVTEAMGRALAPEPYLSSIMLACQALARAGSDAQRAHWLVPALEGKSVLALAHQERASRYDVDRIATHAHRTTDGFRLHGQKTQVLGGYAADAYIVSAGTDDACGGISLFLVPGNAPGLSVVRQRRLDSRNAAVVDLTQVEVPASALIGELGAARTVLQDAIDVATIALCGEMLGGMSEAFERTLGYLKQRRQFGVLIGTFQALRHRAARSFIEIELARAATMLAARAWDRHDPEARSLLSIAKARCSDAYVLVTSEAVQMHGGIGMTDEHDIGFFLKHARTCELTFGDAAFHRERYAGLHGY